MGDVREKKRQFAVRRVCVWGKSLDCAVQWAARWRIIQARVVVESMYSDCDSNVNVEVKSNVCFIKWFKDLITSNLSVLHQ